MFEGKSPYWNIVKPVQMRERVLLARIDAQILVQHVKVVAWDSFIVKLRSQMTSILSQLPSLILGDEFGMSYLPAMFVVLSHKLQAA